MEDFTDITLLEAPLLDGAGFMQLLLRFAFNMLVIFGIIQFFLLLEKQKTRLLLHFYTHKHQRILFNFFAWQR